MKEKFGFDTYLSPFTYRYGTDDMRKVWSAQNFWRYARNIWVQVAQTQKEAGIVTKEQLDDLRKHIYEIDVERILEIEKKGTGHDVMAAIQEFSEKAPIGGAILHQGLTSEDITSNVETLLIRDSYDFIIRPKLRELLLSYAGKIDKYKDLVCMGYTHLQAAEPTTVGYRFAEWAQDLLIDLNYCDFIRSQLKGKGIKGAVGTSASIENVLSDSQISASEHEKNVMHWLGLGYVSVASQTYPRKFAYLTLSGLAGIAQSLHRSHFNLQLLQSSFIDEVAEPRRRGEVGSSAMPHKQNPKISENICSLMQEMGERLHSAWTMPAFITLERTLRDSAAKRSWLPESFLAIDEGLAKSKKVIEGLTVNEASVQANLAKFAPFSASEIILGKISMSGMDRNLAHQILVEIGEKAMEVVRSGQPNPLRELVLSDSRIADVLGKEAIELSFDRVFSHVGNAQQRCIDFLRGELYPALK